jgi:hypothetical protein
MKTSNLTNIQTFLFRSLHLRSPLIYTLCSISCTASHQMQNSWLRRLKDSTQAGLHNTNAFSTFQSHKKKEMPWLVFPARAMLCWPNQLATYNTKCLSDLNSVGQRISRSLLCGLWHYTVWQIVTNALEKAAASVFKLKHSSALYMAQQVPLRHW